MNNSLRVVARFKAKEGKEEKLKRVLLELIEPTRSEKGSISYELLENREDPTEFTFVEEWRDDKALKKHLNTPHVQNAIDEFPDILATEMDLRVYDLIEA